MVKRFVKFCAVCAAIFFASSIAIVIFYRFAPVRITPLMLIRKAEAISKGERLELKHDWVPYEKISPDVVCAVIESEDSHFYEHGGFSYNDMLDAFYLNKRMGRIVAGGSTISQQTAKNVFTFGTDTWLRKGMEAWWTVLIEHIWGKNRILELYLNVAEMGKGIFGAELAAQAYYELPASDLDARQAIALAVCLPHPLVSNPTVPAPSDRRRRTQLMNQYTAYCK
jgi:monofunctional biosynthetic peptidoglycan transglycosylase